MIKRRPTVHNSRYANRLAAPLSKKYGMKNFIAYCGAFIWNLLLHLASGKGIYNFTKKAWKSTKLKQLNFSADW